MAIAPAATTSSREAPLLGVCGRWGSAEIALAHRFDELHQLIYTRGGIRPSNAALEELAKLVLIRLWCLRHPLARLAPGVLPRDLFTAARPVDAAAFAAAFAAALSDPRLRAVDPAGRTHPVWPSDEPFRLANPSVLAAAAALVAELVPDPGRAGSAAVHDPLGAAFDALLAGRYDHAGGLGTYLTPSAVARMMAEVAFDLLDPQVTLNSGPAFGDPYCGTGRFLVAMLELLREKDCASLLRAGGFGADASPSAVAKARINLLLYGVAPPLVWTVRDSVTDDALTTFEGRIALILTNPPFGGGKYDDPAGLAQTAAAIPRLARRSRIDPALACLVRSVRLLAPRGVLGIVLPDGIVGSPAFADVLRGSVGLAASVSLPVATFSLSGTVAKTSAIFLIKDRKPSNVALARVGRVGYLRQGGKAAPDPTGNDLPALPSLLHECLARSAVEQLVITSTDPLVALVPATKVDPARLDPAWLKAGSQLPGSDIAGPAGVAGELAGRTDRKANEPAGPPTADPATVRLGSLLSACRPNRARDVGWPFVSVLHIDDLGTVDWPAARQYRPITPGLRARPGELIVSLLNPSKLRAAVVPDHGEIHVSTEFGVFQAVSDPYAVLALLYSPQVRAQLRPLGSGTSSSRRRIVADDVLNLLVPCLSAAEVERLGQSVRAAVSLVDTGRRSLSDQFSALGHSDPGSSDPAVSDPAVSDPAPAGSRSDWI